MKRYYMLSKKTLFFLIVVIATLLLTNNFLIKSHIENLRRKVISLKLNSLQNVSKNHISLELRSGERVFDYLYEWMLEEDTAGGGIEEFYKKWEALLKLSDDITYIYMGTHSGDLYVRPEYQIDEDYVLEKRPWYIEASDNPGRKNWLIYREYTTHEPLLFLGRTIRLSGGRSGVLGIDISKSTLSGYLSEILKDSEGESIFLVNRLNYIKGGVSNPTIDDLAVRTAFEKIGGRRSGYFIQGDFYVFFSSLFIDDWKLMNFVEVQEIERELTSYKNLSEAFNFFQMLIAVMGILLILYRLSLLWGRDSLTGLMNREAFDTLLSSCDRSPRGYCIIFIDIDDFKLINDTYGHQTGDAVLKRMGELIGCIIPPGDTAYRYGGEEFVIHTYRGIQNAYILGEDIREQVEALRWREDFLVTVSLGIGQSSWSRSSKCVVKKADDLLYKSKKEGKNRISIEI